MLLPPPPPLWTSHLRLSVKWGVEMKVLQREEAERFISRLKPRVFRNQSRRISKPNRRMRLVSAHPVISERLINLRWNTTSLCGRKLLIGSAGRGAQSDEFTLCCFADLKDEHPHLEGVWMFSQTDKRSQSDYSELVLHASAGVALINVRVFTHLWKPNVPFQHRINLRARRDEKLHDHQTSVKLK